jgi:hypothetical protein
MAGVDDSKHGTILRLGQQAFTGVQALATYSRRTCLRAQLPCPHLSPGNEPSASRCRFWSSPTPAQRRREPSRRGPRRSISVEPIGLRCYKLGGGSDGCQIVVWWQSGHHTGYFHDWSRRRRNIRGRRNHATKRSLRSMRSVRTAEKGQRLRSRSSRCRPPPAALDEFRTLAFPCKGRVCIILHSCLWPSATEAAVRQTAAAN